MKLIERVNAEMVRIDTEEGLQIWTRGRLRKAANCCVTRKPIADEYAWRPLTNFNNRWHRMSDDGLARLTRVHAANKALTDSPQNP